VANATSMLDVKNTLKRVEYFIWPPYCPDTRFNPKLTRNYSYYAQAKLNGKQNGIIRKRVIEKIDPANIIERNKNI
jgi:hypothetical protein